MSTMWRSKLGNEFLKSEIDRNERNYRRQLDDLRKHVPENRKCADCDTVGTVWASVNLGVFLCMRCGANHRAVGTHISLPKGCTGTYLWGPDELERMREIGNARAKVMYGGAATEVDDLSDEGWKAFVIDKYVNRKFVPSVIELQQQQQPDLIDLSETKQVTAFPSIQSKAKGPVGDDFFSSFGL